MTEMPIAAGVLSHLSVDGLEEDGQPQRGEEDEW